MKKINKILKIGTLFAAPLLASASILTLTSCSSNSDPDIPTGGDSSDQGDQQISPEDIQAQAESGYVLNESKTGIIEKNGDDSNKKPYLIRGDFSGVANRTKDGKEIHHKVSLKVQPGYYFNKFANVFKNDPLVEPKIKNSWYRFNKGFDIEFSIFKEDNGEFTHTPISENLKWYQNENFIPYKKEYDIRLPIENQYILNRFKGVHLVNGIVLKANSNGMVLFSSHLFHWRKPEYDIEYIKKIFNEDTSYTSSNDVINHSHRFINVGDDLDSFYVSEDIYFDDLKYDISITPYLK